MFAKISIGEGGGFSRRGRVRQGKGKRGVSGRLNRREGKDQLDLTTPFMRKKKGEK